MKSLDGRLLAMPKACKRSPLMRCGSFMPSGLESPAAMQIPAGAIDSPLPPLPAVHLYVGSKAPWYEITDSWPQFEELPPPEQVTGAFR